MKPTGIPTRRGHVQQISYRVLVHILGLWVASVFLFSGLTHLVNQYDFLHRVLEYRLVPIGFSTLIAGVIPYFQLTVACCLLLNVLQRGAWLIASCLFIVFTVAQILALTQGLDIDCGCFGFQSHPISVAGIIFVGSMALVSCICFRIGCKNV